MKLIVNPHKIEIDKSPVNEREINISKCEFVFSDEITSDYVKEAYFTFDGETYKQIIVNNECDFPSEVLVKKGTVEIGVVAFLVEDETEIKRYNPSPAYFNTWQGSLKDDYENTEPITPTDKEQIEQAITNLQNDVDDLDENKQDKLISGENIKTINGESVLGSGNIEIDLSDYYTKEEVDESQTAQNVQINANKGDIESLNNRLTNYSLITETGSQIALNVNSSNYQMTAILKDKNGNVIYTSNVIDLPLESMIVSATYDSTTKEIVFTLQNGNVLRVSVADLVSGLVSTDDLNTILANYYTKTEIDTLLQTKANASDVYAKTDVYNKTETDTLLNAKQNTLTFDNTPTENSTNPVTSGGIYDSQEEQDTNIELLQNLVNQMPTVEATGTDISLQDVLNYRFMKFVMKGNSSQFSTTGKNLLNPTISSTTKNGVILSYDATTQEITLNGTCDTNNTTFNFTPQSNTIPANTTIYSLLKYVSGSSTGKLSLQIYDSGFSKNAGVSTDSGLSADITSSVSYSSETTFSVNRIRVDDGSSFTNLKFKVYLSTVDNEYEIYTGGTPAPNPSYPYPVKTVTGENSLIISNSDNTQTQTFTISLGSIELCKIGDYQDYIYKSGNNWYKKEMISKVQYLVTGGSVGSGGGDFATMKTRGYLCRYFDITNLRGGSDRSLIMSNRFKGTNATLYNGAAYLDGIQTASSDTSSTVYIGIKFSTIEDYYGSELTTSNIQTAWIKYFTDHPTYIYFRVLEPQDILITDTTLINQLNNIYNNAHSYNGTTNITTTYADGNEQMIIEASALSDIFKQIQSNTNAILEIGGD